LKCGIRNGNSGEIRGLSPYLLKDILDVHAYAMYIACTLQRGGIMPILQVRDLPEDVYVQLNYLAEKEHRSMAQIDASAAIEIVLDKADSVRFRDLLLQNPSR